MADHPRSTHPSCLEAERLSRRAFNAPVRTLLTHWLMLHDREQLPDRSRFDTAALPEQVLPYLFLLERTPDGCEPGGRWRLTLSGSHVTCALGRDFTGCVLVDEQIPGISRSRTLRLLGPLAETGLPAHFHGTSSFRPQDGYGYSYHDHEQVLLPFRSGGDGVDFVAGAIVYEESREATPAPR